MPLYSLLAKADLENIDSIELTEPVYHLKFKCSKCNEVTKAFHPVDMNDQLQGAKQDRGNGCNYTAKCKLCKHTFYVTVLKALPLTATNSEWVCIAEFECRGTAPVCYEPLVMWKTTDGKFNDIELEEGDWCDYGDDVVSVLNFKSKFE